MIVEIKTSRRFVSSSTICVYVYCPIRVLDSPERLDPLRVPEADLPEPVADQLGHVEGAHGAGGDVPGHVLPHTLPVTELV